MSRATLLKSPLSIEVSPEAHPQAVVIQKLRRRCGDAASFQVAGGGTDDSAVLANAPSSQRAIRQRAEPDRDVDGFGQDIDISVDEDEVARHRWMISEKGIEQRHDPLTAQIERGADANRPRE